MRKCGREHAPLPAFPLAPQRGGGARGGGHSSARNSARAPQRVRFLGCFTVPLPSASPTPSPAARGEGLVQRSRRQKSRHFCAQQRDQCLVHEIVFVGDVEADQAQVFELGLVALLHFVRCAFSMTKTMSAQRSESGVSGFSASLVVPADAVSMPGCVAKTCSAVGLRRRFWLQMKRTFFTRA